MCSSKLVTSPVGYLPFSKYILRHHVSWLNNKPFEAVLPSVLSGSGVLLPLLGKGRLQFPIFFFRQKKKQNNDNEESRPEENHKAGWFCRLLVSLHSGTSLSSSTVKKKQGKKRILSNNYHFHKLGAERSDSKEILRRSRASLFISNCLINGIFSFLVNDYNIVI